MNKRNTRRGDTQKNVNKNGHSRGFLSGIYNACRYHKNGKTLLNRCVEEPRFYPAQKPCGAGFSGMTALFHNGLAVCGFTLIELLVVVLIIGILAAVALPQYQKAVLKSRYAALMPIAKSIANGNEAYYMEHGTYATNPANLDIAGQKNYPDGTLLDVYPDGTEGTSEDYSFVIAGRDNNFPLNYLVYQKHSPKFAGNIHCEADGNNAMAQEVCKSLGGQYIDGSQTEGFMTYVLEGNIGSDRLPSSLTKLAANLQQSQCVGKTNCTATVQGNQVVVSECGGYMSYRFNAAGNRNSGPGCMKTSYNAESTQTGKFFESCSGIGEVVGSSCLPGKYTYSPHMYIERFAQKEDGTGERLISISSYIDDCIEGIGCSKVGVAYPGESRNHYYNCPSGQIVNTDTLECEAY